MGMDKILFHIIPNSSFTVLHEVALFTIKLTPRLIKLQYVKAWGENGSIAPHILNLGYKLTFYAWQIDKVGTCLGSV